LIILGIAEQIPPQVYLIHAEAFLFSLWRFLHFYGNFVPALNRIKPFLSLFCCFS